MDTIDIGHELIDRRVVDREGRVLGRVDDLELSAGKPVHVTAILLGPEALGRRLGGVLGRFVAGFGRLRPDGAAAPRIAWDRVVEWGVEVRTDLDADDLDFPRSEAWMREHVIDRLPFAGTSSDSGPPGDTEGEGGGA